MTSGKDRSQGDGAPSDLTDEIKATMAEAEAAVTRLGGDEDEELDDDEELIEEEEEEDDDLDARVAQLEGEVAPTSTTTKRESSARSRMRSCAPSRICYPRSCR